MVALCDYTADCFFLLTAHRSTFACNRVRPLKITKWVIKEFENVEVPESDHGVFYSSESYVIRWAFTITVRISIALLVFLNVLRST